MADLFKIAVRNLLRYKRRTLLTGSLIAIGVVFVVVFGAASGAFKNMMVGQMTDSMLGHLQVHQRGYVASIDNLPLTLMMSPAEMAVLDRLLTDTPGVAAFSPRVKFTGLFSNYLETTGIRLNGVDPDREWATVPLFPSRIKQGEQRIGRGEIVIPELLASGMNVKLGDTVVIIATNKDGSVNAGQFKVSGVLESVTGPGGRDGYMHIDDAIDLLRMEEREISEVAVRLDHFGDLHRVASGLTRALAQYKDEQGRPVFEVHTWEGLSPFYNVAVMIDLLTISIRVALIAIVLISVMNVMLMAVYERIKEIGTIAAMGTLPGKILSMFVIEGFTLGLFGTVVGGVVGALLVVALGAARLTFDFGRQTGLVLSPTVNGWELLTISVIVIVVSVVASVQPAFKASRMEPVDALRH